MTGLTAFFLRALRERRVLLARCRPSQRYASCQRGYVYTGRHANACSPVLNGPLRWFLLFDDNEPRAAAARSRFRREKFGERPCSEPKTRVRSSICSRISKFFGLFARGSRSSTHQPFDCYTTLWFSSNATIPRFIATKRPIRFQRSA